MVLTAQAGCTYLDVLTFYHHAGLIMAARQDYASAKDLFLVVRLESRCPQVKTDTRSGNICTDAHHLGYTGRSGQESDPVRTAPYREGESASSHWEAMKLTNSRCDSKSRRQRTSLWRLRRLRKNTRAWPRRLENRGGRLSIGKQRRARKYSNRYV